MAIDTEHPTYRAMKPAWKRMRDVLAGQSAMRAIAEDYLRRPMGLTDAEEWARYVNATPFFEATLRTMEGLTGLAFYRDPEITLPDGMKAFVTDATQDGVPFRQFIESVFEEVLSVARVGVLVDFPPKDESVVTRRDEEKAGRRPFVRKYVTEDIFWWETTEVNGTVVLSEVRLKEIETEKVGDFDIQWRKRIRVLQLVKVGKTWEYRQRVFTHNVWEKEDGTLTDIDGDERPALIDGNSEDSTSWTEGPTIVPKIDGKALDYIPFWIINPTDQSPVVKRPPLLGLADVNVSHFSTSAALENALFWCGNPQPYITGLDSSTDRVFTVGSSSAWIFDNPDTKVDFLSFGADNLVPLEKRLDRLEQHMAVLGARMLSADQRTGVEAAETARIHRQGEVSVLAGVCGSVSRAMMDVAVVATEWDLQASADVVVKIMTSFYDAVLTVADALNVIKIWQAGFMAPEDVLALLKKGELVKGDRTLEAITAENQSSPIQPILPAMTQGGTGASGPQPGGPKPPTPAPKPTPTPAPKPRSGAGT